MSPAPLAVRRRSAPSPFDPSQLPNLGLWLKTDSTLWQDSARTTAATADGDPVGAWDDAASGAHHATQSTTTKRPLLKTGIVNGRKVLRFDGVDDFLASNADAATRPVTACVVASFTDFVNYRSPLGSSGTGGFSFRPDKDGQANARKMQLLKQGNVLIASESTALALATFYILTVTYDTSGNYVFYRNGTVDGSGTNNVAFTTPRTTLVGIGNPTQEPMFGDIPEIVECTSILSAGDLTRLHRYLGAKYGISVP